jgi:malate synthase
VYKRQALVIVRPRGWHLDEKHVLVNGKPIPAALFDFGVYFYTAAQKLIARGAGPYFYLPKLEHYEEAKLWADIFAFSEETLDLAHGTIKATVLIETILASFQMHEILHALKDYCVGLNCGRWDYIFSFIKKFAHYPDRVLPDRAQVTMTSHFLRSYSLLCIQTCHRRGASAIGGMSAYIPVRANEAANTRAFAMVRADKEREALDGHDGTWVAHPGLIPIAMEVFNRAMQKPNQLDKRRDDVVITAADLLKVPQGEITETGLRNNISVAVQYIAAWLTGQGCVPINNLMEDAATAEIARSQIWQWIHHEKGVLEDGRKITIALYRALLAEEIQKIHDQFGERLPYDKAAALVTELVSDENFVEFLTVPGYRQLP